MKRNKKRLIAAVAVIAALAAGGAAFTAAIDTTALPNGTTAGYAAITVNGATLTDANYTLNSTGTTITEVNFTFADDLTGDNLSLAFNGGSLGLCTHGSETTGVVPGSDVNSGVTTITCDVSETTTTATSLNVAVTNN
jgi:hypothetical protein